MPSCARRCSGSDVMSSPRYRIQPDFGGIRPDSTSNRLVLPAPFGPMTPSTSPGSTESEMPCRIERPPRSSVMSRQAKSGGDAIVTRRSPPRRLAQRALPEHVWIDDLVLVVLHLEEQLRHALLELLGADRVSRIRIVRAFLERVVHAHIAAHAAIRRLAHPVAYPLEIGGIADRFPRGLQVIGHVVAVAGVAEAHDA